MNITDLQRSLPYLFNAELTAFIWGHKGIGKTAVVKEYAKSKGYHFFPFYLGTQSDLGDVLGLATFVKDEDGNDVATKFAMPEWLKNAIDYCNHNPKSGAVIFFDEFNQARKDILSGMFSFALDKTFHTIKLPKNCHIIAAGNPNTEDYSVTDVSSAALMSRFVHIKLEPSVEEWLSYAEKSGIDSTLTGFIKEQPKLLSDAMIEFSLPNTVDPRAYERLDRFFKQNPPADIKDQITHSILGIERSVAYKEYLNKQDRPLLGKDVLAGQGRDLILTWSNPENIQGSMLNITVENVQKHIQEMAKENMTFSTSEEENFMWLLSNGPKDILYPLIKGLVDEKNPVFKTFYLKSEYLKQVSDWIKEAKGGKTEVVNE